MESTPYKLLSGSERAALSAHVHDAHAAWLRAWVPNATAAAELFSAPLCEVPGLGENINDWLAFSTANGILFIADAQRTRQMIASALSRGAAERLPAEKSIAADLLDAALADLATRVAGATATRSTIAATAPDSSLWYSGSGAAWIGVPCGDGELDAVVDAQLVAHVLADVPRPARRGQALANPQHCLGRQPVEIRVWLGTAELELSLFQTLAVDDVLLLDSRIDQPLRVTVAGRDVAPRAYLGLADESKAVRLVAQSAAH